MGHYEVLGVDPAASMQEIRQSYLRLARESHPDFHGADSPERVAAEVRMRELNAAWAVLGDVDQRSAYDRQRLSGRPRPSAPFHASTAGHERWKPFDEGPVAGFDERDDRPITSSRLPRWLAMGPPILGAAGLVAAVVGSLLGVMVLVELGVVSLVVSAVLFLAAPMVALSSSRREDRRA